MAKILIVDDYPANLKLFSTLLRQAGHEVLLATDAQAGIALARAEQPALVLMDIELPGMDGLTAVRLLKADPATRHIAIVAITAFFCHSAAPLWREAGCSACIDKPVHRANFMAQVNLALSAAQDAEGQP